MTNDLLYLLLRASINASLSDRDAFYQQDGPPNPHEQQTHKDPEAARRLSDHIAGAMEGLNSTLLLRQLFTPRRDKKLTQTLDQLTTAVEKLNALLEDSSFPPQPSKPEEQ